MQWRTQQTLENFDNPTRKLQSKTVWARYSNFYNPGTNISTYGFTFSRKASSSPWFCSLSWSSSFSFFKKGASCQQYHSQKRHIKRASYFSEVKPVLWRFLLAHTPRQSKQDFCCIRIEKKWGQFKQAKWSLIGTILCTLQKRKRCLGIKTLGSGEFFCYQLLSSKNESLNELKQWNHSLFKWLWSCWRTICSG